MKRIWTIIGVRDVRSSSTWYQSLLGQPKTPPAHEYFGQVLDTDGTMLLCLHQWGAHEHPSLASPVPTPPGNGLLLFFRVDDFDTAVQRARALVTMFEEEPHVNPNTRTAEFSVRDPDGYHVTVSSWSVPGHDTMDRSLAFGNATPIFRIFDEGKAKEFYVDFLGFAIDWEHRFESGTPLYMQVSKDGCVLHLSEHHGDATPGASVRIQTSDVDAYQRVLASKQYKYARPGVQEMSWGTRDMTISDPFGNKLTFTTR